VPPFDATRRAFVELTGGTLLGSTYASAGDASQRGGGAGRRDEFPVHDRLGATHVDPGYTFTDDDALNEGAAALQQLGSNVVKVWFHLVSEKYAPNSDWPSFDSMVEQARHPYFRELFDRPFTTFHLSAYSFGVGEHNHYFRTGVSDRQYEREAAAFYDLTRHLLETYRGTGTEFVLQHWQGDWGVVGEYDRSKELTETAVEGMIRWLNARQAGIERARAEVDSDVKVFGAAEVNIVLRAMERGERRVVNAVLPETDVDLVSHNAYEEMHRGFVPPTPNNYEERPEVTPPEQVALMRETLDYVNDHAPEPSAYVRESLVDPTKNVFVGEYGFPAATKGTKAATRLGKLATRVALDWGARWVVYWQLYDNEEKGYWLVRPDGSKTPTWRYFRRLVETNTVPSPPEYVELRLDYDRTVDDRAFRCAELELEKPDGENVRYDVGGPMAEPLIWRGAFWTEENDRRSWRWFGGRHEETIVYVHREIFDGATRLRLYGVPKVEGITARVSVDGDRTDTVAFDERRWRDFHADLRRATTTTRSTRTSTRATSRSSTATTAGTSTATTTSTSQPGFGVLTGVAGLGLGLYRSATADGRDE
jgi:hypothetical protein